MCVSISIIQGISEFIEVYTRMQYRTKMPMIEKDDLLKGSEILPSVNQNIAWCPQQKKPSPSFI